MSDLNAAIASTVNNQNEVSDFVNTPEAAAPSAVTEGGEASAPPSPISPLQKILGIKPKPQKRGRGRPPGTGKHQKKTAQQSTVWAGAAPQTPPPEPGAALSPDMPDAQADQRHKAAQGATMLVQTSGMMLAGEEGKMDRDERANVEESFDRYFEAKGISDFPPGIALGLALGGYYVRVLTTEAARPRVSVLMAWAKSKFSLGMSAMRRRPAPDAEGEEEGKRKGFFR
jgi:hypothetical protein